MFGDILTQKEFHTPRNIIFSPHVDDEVIGCFTALDRGIITDVVYFYDLDEERKTEALYSAAVFGFKAWFCREVFPGCSEIPSELWATLHSSDRIFCPTARDSHPQHAEVSRTARNIKLQFNCELVFYTVDMESFQTPLPIELREKKKAALEEIFPSQSVLLQNEKYHLFEGYSTVDHIESISIRKGPVTVVLKGHRLPSIVPDILDDEQDVDYLNRLIVSVYNRQNVNHIAVYRENRSVEFNG